MVTADLAQEIAAGEDLIQHGGSGLGAAGDEEAAAGGLPGAPRPQPLAAPAPRARATQHPRTPHTHAPTQALRCARWAGGCSNWRTWLWVPGWTGWPRTATGRCTASTAPSESPECGCVGPRDAACAAGCSGAVCRFTSWRVRLHMRIQVHGNGQGRDPCPGVTRAPTRRAIPPSSPTLPLRPPPRFNFWGCGAGDIVSHYITPQQARCLWLKKGRCGMCRTQAQLDAAAAAGAREAAGRAL